MAEAGSWPSIQKYGLLSTSALLDLFEVTGSDREALESHQRKKMAPINHPEAGEAIIRDQHVLHERAIGKFLDGIKISEYYKLLNSKTFFWARDWRLQNFLNAYQGTPHEVITVDTRELVRRHEPEITLSRINSGAFFGSGRRGPETFQRIESYQFYSQKDGRKQDVAELAVKYAVKDIVEITIKVERFENTGTRSTIWQGSR